MSEMKSFKQWRKNKRMFVSSCAGCESVFNLPCMLHLSKFLFSFKRRFFLFVYLSSLHGWFYQPLDLIFPFFVLVPVSIYKMGNEKYEYIIVIRGMKINRYEYDPILNYINFIIIIRKIKHIITISHRPRYHRY